MRGDGVFAVGAAAADTPPASAKDIPAAPHAGKAILERFRFKVFFARAMAEPPVTVSRYTVTLRYHFFFRLAIT